MGIDINCSGVYAGDPAKLSMKAAFGKVWTLEQKGGSIIAGTLKTIQERKNNPPPPRDPSVITITHCFPSPCILP